MNFDVQRALAIALSIGSMPCLFLGILVGWGWLDRVRGSKEVSRFIREHREVVSRRLADPKVHSFSLKHAPDNPAVLVIGFDVDDRATYLMLEEDMDKAWGLRFPAQWDTSLRSKEDLGNNYGFAAQGIGIAVKMMHRMLITAVVSIVLPLAYLVPALRRMRTSESG